MPRVPRYTIDALHELDRQLAYAPRSTRERHMQAAEALIGDLDLDRNYPEDYIVFRITGYRSDHVEPATFVGRALVRDLSTMITSLSDGLDLHTDADRPAMTIADAAAYLGVSEKTVHRYRREGLVCHYVLDENGRKRLCCFVDQLDAFAVRNTERTRRARLFNRLDDATSRQIVIRARAMSEQSSATLNQVARQLAAEHGRAHETIRLLLRRHDASAENPIFQAPGPLTDRQVQIIGRAWRWDVSIGRLAARFEKTRPTIHRAVNVDRADRLRSLQLEWIELPTFSHEDAEQVILTPRIVVSGLVDPPAASNALPLVHWAHGNHQPLSDEEEDALVAAFNILKRRAWRAIEALSPRPGSDELDQIETDLRWAGMLKRRLVFLGLPAAILAVERALERRLDTQPADAMVDLIRRAFTCAGRAAEAVDPSRGQRAARLSAFIMDRDLALTSIPESRQRADARHVSGTIQLPRCAAETVTWHSLVDLPQAWLKHINSLPPAQQNAIARRYGLDGSAPRTIGQLESRLGLKRLATLNLLADARRSLRRFSIQKPAG